MRYGSWWAVQPIPGLSLGVHLDVRRRTAANDLRYGPYVDLHLLRWVVSVGVNPAYRGRLDLLESWAHGGINAEWTEGLAE